MSYPVCPQHALSPVPQPEPRPSGCAFAIVLGVGDTRMSKTPTRVAPVVPWKGPHQVMKTQALTGAPGSEPSGWTAGLPAAIAVDFLPEFLVTAAPPPTRPLSPPSRPFLSGKPLPPPLPTTTLSAPAPPGWKR